MTHSLLAWVARAAFFIVMILQYISFASYPARYENQNGWYALLLLCIPSLILWFLVVCNEKLITWVFSVWGLYVWLALVPIIGVRKNREGFVLWTRCLDHDPLPNTAPFAAVAEMRQFSSPRMAF